MSAVATIASHLNGERFDEQIVQLQQRLRQGKYSGEAFRRDLAACVAHDQRVKGACRADDFIHGLFQIPRPGIVELVNRRFSQHYCPLRGDALHRLLECGWITPGDNFFDLGSGLHKVVLVVRLGTGASGTGVELNGTLAAQAREIVAASRLSRVEVVEADLLSADLSKGTVFFAYAPLWGEDWEQLAHRLALAGRAHKIKVIVTGPVNPLDRLSPSFTCVECRADFFLYETNKD